MHFNVGKKAKRRGEVLWGITHGAAGGRTKELSRTAFLCENVKRRREREWGIGERTEGNGVKASEMEGKGGKGGFNGVRAEGCKATRKWNLHRRLL